MKSLTGISQGFDKHTKAALQNSYFWGTHSDALKYDRDILIMKSAGSLKRFWYEEVAGRWIETKIC